jgi:hypothetical protein
MKFKELTVMGSWPRESGGVTSSCCAESHPRAAVEKGAGVIGTGANGESNGRHDHLDEAATGAGVSPVFHPTVSLHAAMAVVSRHSPDGRSIHTSVLSGPPGTRRRPTASVSSTGCASTGPSTPLCAEG